MTAADVYWAPYLERMAAHVPALHRGLKVCSLVITPTMLVLHRGLKVCSGRFESLLCM